MDQSVSRRSEFVNFSGLLEAIGPATSVGYAARPVPHSELHFVGRGSDGCPVVMLGSRDTPHGLAPSIRLSVIEVHFAVRCEVRLPDCELAMHRLSVIRCLSKDPELQRYFLKVCEALVKLIGGAPAFTQVTGALRRVVALFQQLNFPPRREVVGLYGELLLCLWAADVGEAVRAWRGDPSARFDFSADEARIDVKTSGRRARQHNFSLDQCRPPPGTVGVFASVLTEPGNGLSLGQLVEEIEARLAGETILVLKLHELVSESLGGALIEGLKARYDDKAARASLRWYLTEDVPAPLGPIPSAVSDVRFQSDLTAVAARSALEILAKIPGAREILPAE